MNVGDANKFGENKNYPKNNSQVSSSQDKIKTKVLN